MAYHQHRQINVLAPFGGQCIPNLGGASQLRSNGLRCQRGVPDAFPGCCVLQANAPRVTSPFPSLFLLFFSLRSPGAPVASRYHYISMARVPAFHGRGKLCLVCNDYEMNISSEAAGKTRGPVFSSAPRNVLRRAAILVASPLAL